MINRIDIDKSGSQNRDEQDPIDVFSSQKGKEDCSIENTQFTEVKNANAAGMGAMGRNDQKQTTDLNSSGGPLEGADKY